LSTVSAKEINYLNDWVLNGMDNSGLRLGLSSCRRRSEWEDQFESSKYWSMCPKGDFFFFKTGTHEISDIKAIQFYGGFKNPAEAFPLLRGYPKADCGCYEGCDAHVINGHKVSFCCNDWESYSEDNCDWSRSNPRQLAEEMKDVDFRSSLQGVISSVLEDVESDDILSKREKRRSQSLARTMSTIRTRRVNSCVESESIEGVPVTVSNAISRFSFGRSGNPIISLHAVCQSMQEYFTWLLRNCPQKRRSDRLKKRCSLFASQMELD